jgi:type IV pilus assembly protein PilO
MKFGIRELIFVIVMLGLLGSTHYFVFKKTDSKKIKMLAEIRSRQTSLSNLQQATAGIANINEKVDELQKAITFFESKLPQEKEIESMLTELSQMAEANSLQTKTVKTLKIETGPNFREQPIQLSLSGDFNGFYSFLLKLEQLSRITRVTQMNLQKINDRDGEMQAQMTLSIFFEPASSGGAVAGAH